MPSGRRVRNIMDSWKDDYSSWPLLKGRSRFWNIYILKLVYLICLNSCYKWWMRVPGQLPRWLMIWLNLFGRILSLNFTWLKALKDPQRKYIVLVVLGLGLPLASEPLYHVVLPSRLCSRWKEYRSQTGSGSRYVWPGILLEIYEAIWYSVFSLLLSLCPHLHISVFFSPLVRVD